MADRVTEHTTIAAPLETIRAVLLDFPTYPEWAKDLKSIEVLETDDQGRGTSVRYRAAGMGRSTSYTLGYDHSDPARVAWKLTDGDIVRKLDGHYEMQAEGDATAVTYELEAELIVPLPGFVKRRTQGRIMHTALNELKARVEGLDGPSAP
ncbi:SRPBCC family protein [Aquihabitans sp. G128]|uniref:SRPBCC family protein n=1 Tax=Aquihabitans sp. G128 TaxID=2849779 RepID=UPI001C2185F8|nr:SRPBCC family protein [Aquihabitans sp. G128]QXC62308.1 SRPBCC family protein [Aquihabitans sp. G128]